MIEAIITGVVAIAVCMINNASQQKRAEAQHNATIALLEYKLDRLEKKVDLHNNAVERLSIVEKKLEIHEQVAEEKFKVANHRIEDLEHEEKARE